MEKQRIRVGKVFGLWIVVGLLLFGLALGLATPAGLLAQTKKVPIRDFLDSTFGIQVWTDPASGNLLAFDAFGNANKNFDLGLPTVFGGGVTRRIQNDGSERVTVVLHTKDALCFGFTGFPGPLVPAFGRNRQAVVAGATASLGDGFQRLEFAVPAAEAGKPLPEILPLAEFLAVNATIMCHGELRTESGFPPGAEGFAQTTQEGLFMTGAPGGCPPEIDENCFPAEKIQFKETRRN